MSKNSQNKNVERVSSVTHVLSDPRVSNGTKPPKSFLEIEKYDEIAFCDNEDFCPICDDFKSGNFTVFETFNI